MNNSYLRLSSILLLGIALMSSGTVFAADTTPRRVTQPEFDAAIANLQTQMDKLTPPVRTIGDALPDNSIVFWADETGQHGLAAQPADEDGPPVSWYVAKEMAENHGLGWRLPTKHELNLLLPQRYVVGGINDGATYWSSTEYDANYVWVQNSSPLDQDHYAKDARSRVRTIRDF